MRHQLYTSILMICLHTVLYAQQHEVSTILGPSRYYRAQATYQISMPSDDSLIEYLVNIAVAPSPNDSMSLYIKYLISYKLNNDTTDFTQFNFYDNGKYIRYNRKGMTEYNREKQPYLFGSEKKNAIQRNALFAELIPQEIDYDIREMMSDKQTIYSFYCDTTTYNIPCHVFTATRYIDGQAARHCIYATDTIRHLPHTIVIKNNPESISQQNIYITYMYSDTTEFSTETISVEMLQQQFPSAWQPHNPSMQNKKITHTPQLPYKISHPIYNNTQ